MQDTCAWKQLIKILLPVGFILLALHTVSIHGDKVNATSSGESSHETLQDRSQKVKAKWRGDSFWYEGTINKTDILLERSKNKAKSSTGNASGNDTAERRIDGSISDFSKESFAASSSPPSGRSRGRPMLSSRPQTNKQPTQNNPGNKGSKGSSSSKKILHSKAKKKLTTPRPTLSSTKGLRQKSKVSSTSTSGSGAKTPRPSAFTSAPNLELDRTTLTADLGPHQDFYLEYEIEDNITEASPNKTKQTMISFYPKSPVNLLYLLQAYASTMKPIRLESPIAGAVPSLPLSVPVKLNPPNSPFLFTLDMDNFLTRLAISLFYSGLAVAPMIYLLLGGIGSLNGLSIVPFTGKKRRKRRSVPERTANPARKWMMDLRNQNGFENSKIQTTTKMYEVVT